MSKVFRIEGDLENYQYLVPTNLGQPGDEPGILNGTPLPDEWIPPRFYIPYPTKSAPAIWPVPDFAAFAIQEDSKSFELLVRFIHQSCQLIPVDCDGRELLLVHVVEVLNCLDRSNSSMMPTQTHVLQYAFHHRFEWTLFKIPETCRHEILCWELTGEPHDEFRATIVRCGLTGLLFREIWSDGK